MPVHSCPDCKKTFLRKDHLKQHQSKKTPCRRIEDTRHISCPDCEELFSHHSSLSRHRLACRLKTRSRQELAELKAKVAELTSDIPPIRTNNEDEFKEIEQALLDRIQALEEDNKKLQAGIAIPLPKVKKWKIIPMNIADVPDQLKAQVYFGLPGNLLKPLDAIPDDAILVKFGETVDFPRRDGEHKKDFGGFNLIDSVVTNNPNYVEGKFKEYMKIKNRCIKGRAEKKSTNDTELFFVQNQAEYEEIVNAAVAIAEAYKRDIENASQKTQILSEIQRESELENLRLKLELMRMQHRLEIDT